jgi:exopolysaccharide production protein ExoZ
MRLHSLQYLRAVAALAVVYSHAVIQVEDYGQYLIDAGAFGVDIFFVISGFIMIFIAKPDDRPGTFFMHRVRRVVPLYWFFTILMAAILLLMPGVFKATVFDVRALTLSLAFIPHWSLAVGTEAWPIVAPGWSLNFEMYFYLIFALSLMLAERFRVAFIAGVITTVFVIATVLNDDNSAIAHFFAKSMVFEFILGMLLAKAWKSGWRLPSSTAAWLLLTAVCFLFLRFPLPRIFEFGVPSLLIVMACLYINVPVREWAVLLGDASYALYLSHIFTLGALRKFVAPLLGEGQLAAYLFVVISLVVCALVSIVIHKYVDNWLLRHERLAGRDRHSAVPSKA